MCARTLECKSEGAEWFKGVFTPPIKNDRAGFPPIKLKKSPPLGYHRTVERGEHQVAKI